MEPKKELIEKIEQLRRENAGRRERLLPAAEEVLKSEKKIHELKQYVLNVRKLAA